MDNKQFNVLVDMLAKDLTAESTQADFDEKFYSLMVATCRTMEAKQHNENTRNMAIYIKNAAESLASDIGA